MTMVSKDATPVTPRRFREYLQSVTLNRWRWWDLLVAVFICEVTEENMDVPCEYLPSERSLAKLMQNMGSNAIDGERVFEVVELREDVYGDSWPEEEVPGLLKDLCDVEGETDFGDDFW